MISITGFVLRWYWRQSGARWAGLGLTRVLPHIIDTLLLLSGAGLMVLSQQYPDASPWLASKLLGLLGYILLGVAAMRLAPGRPPAIAAFVMALLTFAWMISVAVSKQAAGFFA